MKIFVHYRAMSRKNSTNNTEVKAIKALLSSDDMARAKVLTHNLGIKLQAFYGQAIRKAIKEASDGPCD